MTVCASTALVYLSGYLDGSIDLLSNQLEIVLHKVSFNSPDVPKRSIQFCRTRIYFYWSFNQDACLNSIMCLAVSSSWQRGHVSCPWCSHQYSIRLVGSKSLQTFVQRVGQWILLNATFSDGGHCLMVPVKFVLVVCIFGGFP